MHQRDLEQKEAVFPLNVATFGFLKKSYLKISEFYLFHQFCHLTSYLVVYHVHHLQKYFTTKNNMLFYNNFTSFKIWMLMLIHSYHSVIGLIQVALIVSIKYFTANDPAPREALRLVFLSPFGNISLSFLN